MKSHYFGTDGIRGNVGGPIINETFVTDFGNAIGSYLNGRGSVAIGHDTRRSAKPLLNALLEGLSRWPVDIHLLDVIPTPGVSYYVAEHACALGVMITASHNPWTDNGLKLFRSDGSKFSTIEEVAFEKHFNAPLPTGKMTATTQHIDGARFYINHLLKAFKPDAFNGINVALDTAHGAAYQTGCEVLKKLGCFVTSIGNKPDGQNINQKVGSEHPLFMCKTTRKAEADIGIALDGDGDRAVLCDENGEFLSGEEILGILAINAIKGNALPNNLIITTIQSNSGLDVSIAKHGGHVIRCDVGDRNVFYKMLETNALIGGESSGHFIFRSFGPTGDGLLTALKIIEIMIATDKPLSELREGITLFPTIEKNLPVLHKKPLNQLALLQKTIRDVESLLQKDGGRVLVRYSGTENKLRILIEGKDKNSLTRHMLAIENAARQSLS